MSYLGAPQPQAFLALRDDVGRVAAAPASCWCAKDDGVQGKARNHFRALASSSYVPELAASCSSTRDETST